MIAKALSRFSSLAWFGVALGVAPLAIAQERAPTAQDVLAKDLRVLLDYFPGRYDNDLQVYFDGELKTPEVERNGRIHSIFSPVTLPAFGPNNKVSNTFIATDSPLQIVVLVYEPALNESSAIGVATTFKVPDIVIPTGLVTVLVRFVIEVMVNVAP